MRRELKNQTREEKMDENKKENILLEIILESNKTAGEKRKFSWYVGSYWWNKIKEKGFNPEDFTVFSWAGFLNKHKELIEIKFFMENMEPLIYL